MLGAPVASPARLESSQTIDRVRRAQRGDPGALDELFADHHDALRRTIARRLGPELRHHLDPDDLVQETFLSAFVALDRYEVRSDATFHGWLVRIAMRKLRDAIRFHRRDKRTPSATYFDATPDPDRGRPGDPEPNWDEDPLERLGDRELGQIAVRCLRRLAPELRAVVLLRCCAEEPWKRVAERLGGRTVGGVRHLHLQAVGELARQITLSVGGRMGLGLS